MKIGELVRDHIDKILSYCEAEPAELVRLMSAEYCRRTFNLAFPFFAEAESLTAHEQRRYWKHRYIFKDRRVRACNHWFEWQRDAFCDYLRAKRIAVSLPRTNGLNGDEVSIPHARSGRYRSIQIGDVQNAVIRFILSRLGEDSFGERDWQETKAYFNNRCAYCGDGAADQMDHGVPINRSKLGEHRLGNLIPACKGCNTGKHHRDYRDHLGSNLERIERIETYMASRRYVPLGENEQVKAILEQAHKEISALAERYIATLNMLLHRAMTSEHPSEALDHHT